MANLNPTLEPGDLFDPAELTDELRELLGPGLNDVVVAAASGDRRRLHQAERRWADAAIAALAIDIEIIGMDRVDPNQTYVVTPLHEGFADVLALLRLPLDLSWVVRDELLGLPYFGNYLRMAGHIAVKPESPRAALRTMFNEAPARLHGGESLVVFPQGSLLGIETAFQAGAFQLAERFETPVLPIVLTGSHRVWDYPFTSKLRWGQRIRLEVLDPVDAHIAVESLRGIERTMKRQALACVDAPARRYVPGRDGLWGGYRFAVDPDFPEVASAVGR